MTHTEQQQKAAEFVRRWSGRGYEKGQAEPFWLALLRDCYGIPMPEEIISFEDSLRVEESQRFVDGRIPSTRVMIEQKGSNIDLTKPDKQSGMTEKLTPFQQAHRYVLGLPLSEHPKWIVVCNFREFHIHDMERPNDKPEVVLLENLPDELHRLQFMVDTESTHVQSEETVSLKAGRLVGELYDKLLLQYGDRPTEADLRSLNVLCVRLVFCLYAEDAHVFKKKKDMFHDYLSMYRAADLRDALIRLFRILDTPTDRRSKFERPELLDFPYVNGGLFSEAQHPIEIPMFTDELRTLLLDKASYGFDWSHISPTIFGAVFENTLNPVERRKGGMHYTSIENIHRLIGPLFLDRLTEELDTLLALPDTPSATRRLEAYQHRLASVRVLDPACGSGNFLTETFLSLRRLENKVIRRLYRGQTMLGELLNPVQVSIEQFYGIEINDFAVNVGKTAMWIAESQMRDETARMITLEDDFLPLTRQTHIHHGNALRIEWSDIVKPEELTYIVGNPPFVGRKEQTKEQKSDLKTLFADESSKMDFVAAWYKKSTQMMQQNPEIRAALVSTNSVVQGEQAAALWQPLVEQLGLHIDFAWRTFVWDGEANVHCVIVGFSCGECERKPIIYDGENRIEAEHINVYLLDMEDVWVKSRRKALCKSPAMTKGFQTTDDNHLTFEETERNEILKKEPEAAKWIRPFSMGEEFISGTPRYCLWLKDASPHDINSLKTIKKKVVECKEYRSNASPSGDAYKLKDVPHLFRPCKPFKDEPYIAIPQTSSCRRDYIPIGLATNGLIPGNGVYFISDTNPYYIGILTSSTHMAWMRAIGGKLKSDYRYSNTIVYNNFPWPEVSESQRNQISELAQTVLDARAAYPDSSLADLYDPDTMPAALRRAHRDLDRAVLHLYGLPPDTPEADIVRHLLTLYKRLAEKG